MGAGRVDQTQKAVGSVREGDGVRDDDKRGILDCPKDYGTLHFVLWQVCAACFVVEDE